MPVRCAFAHPPRVPGSPRRDSVLASIGRVLVPAMSLVLALTVGWGCTAAGDERIAGRGDSASAERSALPPYQVVDVARSGAIVGTVTLTLPVPADTIFQVPDSQAGLCGRSRSVPVVKRRGELVQDVVVWLADARSGKQLPIDRRYQITSADCSLEPRVQAAIEGGMLNVRNSDPSAHRTVFERDGDTLTIVRESEAGQVVPTGKVLARHGLVDVRSDRYPWSRAWIRVFDHPYFAATNRDGTFTIDSVPPGKYRLIAWEARLGTRESEVMVKAATDSKVDLSF